MKIINNYSELYIYSEDDPNKNSLKPFCFLTSFNIYIKNKTDNLNLYFES